MIQKSYQPKIKILGAYFADAENEEGPLWKLPFSYAIYNFVDIVLITKHPEYIGRGGYLSPLSYSVWFVYMCLVSSLTLLKIKYPKVYCMQGLDG